MLNTEVLQNLFEENEDFLFFFFFNSSEVNFIKTTTLIVLDAPESL